MHIVTSGSPYLDIDAYAGIVAYAELLQAQGTEAIAATTAVLNESITPTIRSWKAPIQIGYQPSADDAFVLIDVSDPDHFDAMVDLAKVSKVIDHHPGLEQYWQARIGDGAHIEFIGAACTLVYERWRVANLLDKMSTTSARLLVCGILDNTLNFGAKVTTQRDIDAYNALLAPADLPDDWPDRYFTECQETILQDATVAIQNDTKTLTFKSFDQPICVGQLVAWDGKQVLTQYADLPRTILSAVRPNWFMNLVSVGEGKSYFITDNALVQRWLSGLLGVHFDGTVAAADRLWLRKEIIKQDITRVEHGVS